MGRKGIGGNFFFHLFYGFLPSSFPLFLPFLLQNNKHAFFWHQYYITCSFLRLVSSRGKARPIVNFISTSVYYVLYCNKSMDKAPCYYRGKCKAKHLPGSEGEDATEEEGLRLSLALTKEVEPAGRNNEGKAFQAELHKSPNPEA